MPKAKPYYGQVENKIAIQLLNMGGDFEGVFLGDALVKTARQLELLVTKANAYLRGNEFAKVMADYLAVQMNRRGDAKISVNAAGNVVLEIHYEEVAARPMSMKRKRRVPLLDELRDEATRMGVDISSFGIKRKAIWRHLEKLKGQTVKETRKSEAVKELSSVKTARDEDDDVDPGPMANGPDESKLMPALDDAKPPRRKGFVKTQDALSSPVVVDNEAAPSAVAPPASPKPQKASNGASERRSMRQMVQESKEVDIGDLLNSEPPEH